MTGRRIYSLGAVQRGALALNYVSRRRLFYALARALVQQPPLFGGRPASREDVAALLHADIDAILHEHQSLTGNAAALCAAEPDAERVRRVYGAERAPTHYEKRRP